MPITSNDGKNVSLTLSDVKRAFDWIIKHPEKDVELREAIKQVEELREFGETIARESGATPDTIYSLVAFGFRLAMAALGYDADRHEPNSTVNLFGKAKPHAEA